MFYLETRKHLPRSESVKSSPQVNTETGRELGIFKTLRSFFEFQKADQTIQTFLFCFTVLEVEARSCYSLSEVPHASPVIQGWPDCHSSLPLGWKYMSGPFHTKPATALLKSKWILLNKQVHQDWGFFVSLWACDGVCCLHQTQISGVTAGGNPLC